VLEVGSGTKFLTISTNPTLWTLFGSHKELGGTSVNKVILEPSVAIVVETHSKVNNQMTIIQIQVRKNIVEDVLIDGGASVNIIIENLITKLGLPKPKPTLYHFKMANRNITKPLGIIRNLKIHIHVIPYVATFTILKNNVVDFCYSMLLGRFWFIDAKVTCEPWIVIQQIVKL
jgi:hypothetical protein